MLSYQHLLYVLANVGVVLTLATAATGADGDAVRLLYVSALFALCSLPLLFQKPLNGPYAILAAFLALYFVFFGLQDLIGAFEGGRMAASTGVLSLAEAVILVGGVLLVLGYRAAVGWTNGTRNADATPKDWAPWAVILIGVVCCGFGGASAWIWKVNIISDTSNTTMERSLSAAGQLQVSLLLIGRLVQPLGLAMLAYAQTVYRKPWLLPLLLAAVLFQVVLGFVADVKGDAMLGGMVVIVTKVLVQGKLPKTWLAAAIAFIVFAFPVFQAHRTAAGMRGTDHAETAANPFKVLSQALKTADDVKSGRHKLQNFFERASLKRSVEVITSETGNGVRFQEGYTLSPLLAAFVPKIIWTGKPSVPTGQLMNSEFKLSVYRDTYISPSHVGELYWNFGWAGVALGMPLIGFILGTVGSRCNLSETTSITRLLIAAITLRQCVQGFEGAIAVAYVVWLRSIAAIGLMHLVLASVPALRHRGDRHSQDDSTALGQTRTVSVP